MDFTKTFGNSEKLRIRYFEVEEFEDGYRVIDPFGFFEDLFFTKEALYLISLFDGTRTIDQVKLDFFKATNIMLSDSEILNFINQMDSYYLFYNDRFINRFEEERKKILDLEYKPIEMIENISQVKNFINKI